MSYNNGPRIVSDNLILHLDASSYYGYGKWLDLSGYESHASLINGVTFDANDFNGAFVFDATKAQYAECFLKTTMTTEYSISVVAKRSAANVDGTVFSSNYGTRQNLRFTSGGSVLVVAYDAMGSWSNYYTGTSALSGDIFNIVFTVNNTNLKIYINNVQKASTTISSIGPINSTDTSVTIGQTGMSWSRQYFTGSIYNISAYNKTLSLSDVDFNYRAIRSKFSM